jgi:hypothetical protein
MKSIAAVIITCTVISAQAQDSVNYNRNLLRSFLSIGSLVETTSGPLGFFEIERGWSLSRKRKSMMGIRVALHVDKRNEEIGTHNDINHALVELTYRKFVNRSSPRVASFLIFSSGGRFINQEVYRHYYSQGSLWPFTPSFRVKNTEDIYSKKQGSITFSTGYGFMVTRPSGFGLSIISDLRISQSFNQYGTDRIPNLILGLTANLLLGFK